jgi:hypothetical protein
VDNRAPDTEDDDEHQRGEAANRLWQELVENVKRPGGCGSACLGPAEQPHQSACGAGLREDKSAREVHRPVPHPKAHG